MLHQVRAIHWCISLMDCCFSLFSMFWIGLTKNINKHEEFTHQRHEFMIQAIPILISVCLCLKILPLIQKLYKNIAPSSIKNKVCLVTYIILGLPITVYPLVLGPAIMVFDSSGAEEDPKSWLIFFALVFYPLVLMLIMWMTTLLLNHKK